MRGSAATLDVLAGHIIMDDRCSDWLSRALAESGSAAAWMADFDNPAPDQGVDVVIDAKFRRALVTNAALWTPVVKALGLTID
jgi:hypothetical protein